MLLDGWVNAGSGEGPAAESWVNAESEVVSRLRAGGCVFAEEEARLLVAAAGDRDELDAMVARRVAGLPLEHIVGWAEFCGLRIAVDTGVFVPRRRTEFLIDQAARLLTDQAAGLRIDQAAVLLTDQAAGLRIDQAAGLRIDQAAGLRIDQAAGPSDDSSVIVLDLCCGSGAMGAALAARIPLAELHSVDVDPAAIRCAERNVALIGGHLYRGDLYEPLPATLRGRIAVIVANVPYVPTGEIALLPAEARVHEARVALDGGTDGLGVLRRVADGAPDWLAPGGHLLIETSEQQASAALAAFEAGRLAARLATDDELGATVVIGTLPA
jgi:release factor glutamine methyltransferase